MMLSGWGRFPRVDAQVEQPRDAGALAALVQARPSLIARGNGRAYGDSAVNAAATIDMRRMNRMLAFDPASGTLVAQAGVLLGDIISVFLPRGWFPLVTPGTRFVTLGGAIAADVHGKNHHGQGSFRSCVDWIEVMDADGAVRRCSRGEEPALFDHTLGGMGLTGVIVRAAIRLRPVDSGWIRQTSIAAPNLAAAMAAFEAAPEATYSVAWIDCLGRGAALGRSLVMLGEHAGMHELPAGLAAQRFGPPPRRALAVPFDLPGVVLNRWAMRLFNSLYYRLGAARAGARLVDWERYFYPLDAIASWNRIYGRRGLVQFQCVLPLEQSAAGLAALLAETSAAGAGSFLAVLKRFGPQDGAFAFPMPGYTLALDFPVTPRTLALLDRLDAITLAHGGRFYLAKDGRMRADTLRASDARVAGFQAFRAANGSNGRFRSAQSERLAL
ncbi:MAG: FAD-binding oxidoreductase [Alphaproteobacteria bacterium]|nr:FAD-binding oxidoreductase [Alphaproteobacteria bacterium]